MPADPYGGAEPAARTGPIRRLSTETKQAFKTTEFWIFIVIALLILIAGNSIEGEEGGSDVFAADKVWLYITVLASAYFVGRGLAKSGSRDPYVDEPGRDGGDSITERIKTAAAVLREGERATGTTARAPASDREDL